MPRLSALEHTPARNIQHLAVPETSRSTPFFLQEVQRLKPQLATIIERAKESGGYWLMNSLWSLQILYDFNEITESQGMVIEQFLEARLDKMGMNQDFWFMAFVRLVAPKYITRDKLLKAHAKMTQILEKDGNALGKGHWSFEYIHTLAAAKILFPTMVAEWPDVNEELRAKLHYEINKAVGKSLTKVGDNLSHMADALEYARDLRLLFHEEKDPFDEKWDRAVIRMTEDLIEFDSSSSQQALHLLGLRKLTMARTITLYGGVLDLEMTSNQSNNASEAMNNPPPQQRSF